MTSRPSDSAVPAELRVLRHVAVIDGRGAAPLPDQALTLFGDRIAALHPDGELAADVGGVQQDLSGCCVLPGLIDAHAHVDSPGGCRALLEMGVTAYRNPARVGLPDPPLCAGPTAPSRAPACLVAGPPLDLAPSTYPGAVAVRTREDVDAAVEAQAAAGVDLIKLYTRLPPALVKAGVNAAHRHGLPAQGDLIRTPWTDAARAGIDFLSHLTPQHPALLPIRVREQYVADLRSGRSHPLVDWYLLFDLDGPECAALCEALVSAGGVLDPTLVTLEAMLYAGDDEYRQQRQREQDEIGGAVQRFRGLGPVAVGWAPVAPEQRQRVWARVREIVAHLHRAGVSIIAGTDTPRGEVVPGLSLHREVELLADAGLSPLEAIACATGRSAAALGLADRGVIAPGKRADLVVMRGDPSRDIAATRAVSRVMLGGRWVVGGSEGALSPASTR